MRLLVCLEISGALFSARELYKALLPLLGSSLRGRMSASLLMLCATQHISTCENQCWVV